MSADSVELVFVPPVASASASVRSPVVSPPLEQPLVVPGNVIHSRYEDRQEGGGRTVTLRWGGIMGGSFGHKYTHRPLLWPLGIWLL